MHDNIIEEPSGNSTEFRIAGFFALLAWLALAGEPTDKFQYMPEQRETPLIKKCCSQEKIPVSTYRLKDCNQAHNRES